MGILRHISLLLLLAGLPLYIFSVSSLKELPQRTPQDVLRVVLPAPIQTVLATGDRYLAADAYITRAMTVSVLTKEATTFEVQGKLQRQASILNPYNEDNVLLASAVLPWQDQVDAAQFVLLRATKYRDWDYMPPFFAGFNEYYFREDYARAGELGSLAAMRVEGKNQAALRQIASKWASHSKDPMEAIRIINTLIAATQDEGQKRSMQARVFRLEWLVRLRRYAEQYQAEQGKPLPELQALVDAGYLPGLPQDPFGYGYIIDDDGVVQFNRPAKKDRR